MNNKCKITKINTTGSRLPFEKIEVEINDYRFRIYEEQGDIVISKVYIGGSGGNDQITIKPCVTNTVRIN